MTPIVTTDKKFQINVNKGLTDQKAAYCPIVPSSLKTTAAPVENAPVLYTPENIMAIMHISRSSVYKLFSSEGFPSIKMGGILRIEKTAFEKWLNTYAGKSFIIG